MKTLFTALAGAVLVAAPVLAHTPDDTSSIPDGSVESIYNMDGLKRDLKKRGIRTNATSPALSEKEEAQFVVNGEVRSVLQGAFGEAEISGRLSMHLEASPEELEKGILRVGGFSLAYFNVPQAVLYDQDITRDKAGVLGFAVNPNLRQADYVRYDAQQGVLSGEIVGKIDTDYLASLSNESPDDKRDTVRTPTQDAVLSFQVQLPHPLDILQGQKDQIAIEGKMQLDLQARPLEELKLPGFLLKESILPIKLEFTLIPLFEVGKRLCIQPVRVFTIKSFFPIQFDYSGEGLAFGMPGAHTQWNKADITFEVREWKSLYKPAYMTLSSDESAGLRGLVNDDDCIEVFFVDKLSPESMWGGGATWGLGTSTSKVISSDGNAFNGIDFTHLAHEFGHVLGLCHPGDPGCFGNNVSSTGTLMCPSGWANDNPAINSTENKTNAHNPLLTFTLKLKGPNTDCADGADCGGC